MNYRDPSAFASQAGLKVCATTSSFDIYYRYVHTTPEGRQVCFESLGTSSSLNPEVLVFWGRGAAAGGSQLSSCPHLLPTSSVRGKESSRAGGETQAENSSPVTQSEVQKSWDSCKEGEHHLPSPSKQKECLECRCKAEELSTWPR